MIYRLSLPVEGSEETVNVDLEVKYYFAPQLFDSLLRETRKQAPVYAKQFEEDMRVFEAKIKDVLQAFPQLSFDYDAFCFFNESEAMREFAGKKRRPKRKPGESTKPHRERCDDCCTIL